MAGNRKGKKESGEEKDGGIDGNGGREEEKEEEREVGVRWEEGKGREEGVGWNGNWWWREEEKGEWETQWIGWRDEESSKRQGRNGWRKEQNRKERWEKEGRMRGEGGRGWIEWKGGMRGGMREGEGRRDLWEGFKGDTIVERVMSFMTKKENEQIWGMANKERYVEWGRAKGVHTRKGGRGKGLKELEEMARVKREELIKEEEVEKGIRKERGGDVVEGERSTLERQAGETEKQRNKRVHEKVKRVAFNKIREIKCEMEKHRMQMEGEVIRERWQKGGRNEQTLKERMEWRKQSWDDENEGEKEEWEKIEDVDGCMADEDLETGMGREEIEVGEDRRRLG